MLASARDSLAAMTAGAVIVAGGLAGPRAVSTALAAAHVQARCPAIVYAVNSAARTVTPIHTATGRAGRPITVGRAPVAIAITPNGRTAYVVNAGSDTIRPIRTATGKAGRPIKVWRQPRMIAITPDGRTAFVAGSNWVIPVRTASNATRPHVKVHGARFLDAIAITPDGKTAYLASAQGDPVTGDGYVLPIKVATRTAGRRIPVSVLPVAIAITPDSKTAYVVNQATTEETGASLTPIRTATNTTGPSIATDLLADSIAITPDGKTAYVGTLLGAADAVDLAASAVAAVIAVGDDSLVAVAPDGRTAYSGGGSQTHIISTATNKITATLPVTSNALTVTPCLRKTATPAR